MANETPEHHDTHDIVPSTRNGVNNQEPGVETLHVEYRSDEVMRAKSDDLTVWQTAKQYKLVTLLAMSAAFSASLDGYRE